MPRPDSPGQSEDAHTEPGKSEDAPGQQPDAETKPNPIPEGEEEVGIGTLPAEDLETPDAEPKG